MLFATKSRRGNAGCYSFCDVVLCIRRRCRDERWHFFEAAEHLIAEHDNRAGKAITGERSHIRDPAERRSADRLGSVTVACPVCAKSKTQVYHDHVQIQSLIRSNERPWIDTVNEARLAVTWVGTSHFVDITDPNSKYSSTLVDHAQEWKDWFPHYWAVDTERDIPLRVVAYLEHLAKQKIEDYFGGEFHGTYYRELLRAP